MTQPPTASDYRRIAQIRDRWHAALTGLGVTAVTLLVFWLLPLPAKAQVLACDRDPVLIAAQHVASVPCHSETQIHGDREPAFNRIADRSLSREVRA